MLKMKRSGYSHNYRLEILDSTWKAFRDIIKDDLEGIKPLFRDRNWNREERLKCKENNKLNWYKNPKIKIEYKTVMIVPVREAFI